MKRLIVLLAILCTFGYTKTLTATLGNKCNTLLPIKGGYTVCHTIEVKYNLEKGRIITHGYEGDSNVVFLVRLWDADSMRIDFVATDLSVNKALAGDEYKVPKELATETKYLDIVILNDDEFSPYRTSEHCYLDDNAVWYFQESIDKWKINKKECLPKDTTLKNCAAIERSEEDGETRIHCYKHLYKGTYEDGVPFIQATDSYWKYDEDHNIVEHWMKCPDGYTDRFQESYGCIKISESDDVNINEPKDACEPWNMVAGKCKE